MEFTRTTYNRWQDGELNDDQALEVLAGQLTSVEDRLGPLQESQKVLRNQISEVVERKGGRAQLAGFGSLQITNPSITATYDTRQLDALVTKLTVEYPDIAAAIASCRKESSRTGSLRINRVK